MIGCYDCGLPYASPAFADFVVADDVWAALTPDAANILCIQCMLLRGTLLGIQAEGRFTSGPFADSNWKKPASKSQGLCDTTNTERFENPACRCDTYGGNLGPCKTFEAGINGLCVYCDHERGCHP